MIGGRRFMLLQAAVQHVSAEPSCPILPAVSDATTTQALPTHHDPTSWKGPTARPDTDESDRPRPRLYAGEGSFVQVSALSSSRLAACLSLPLPRCPAVRGWWYGPA